VPVLLDTDLTSFLQQQTEPGYSILQEKLSDYPSEELCTSILSFHEQVKGWMAYINRARSGNRVVLAYSELKRVLDYYCSVRVLPFNSAAEERYSDLRRKRVRIGTMDLRIASIALATGSLLLSRNLRDFRSIPGLRVEDWTR
jgi:tRNA(fMet)-specific endonuclease VapC